MKEKYSTRMKPKRRNLQYIGAGFSQFNEGLIQKHVYISQTGQPNNS